MPSRNCFDLLVKTFVVLSYVIACPGLNFIYDVVVLEFFGVADRHVSDHARRTMFDEFNDSSILKTGRLARSQQPSSLGTALRASP
jgi:hypothetical protein